MTSGLRDMKLTPESGLSMELPPEKASIHLDESSKTKARCVMFRVLKNIGCMSVKVGIL